MFILEELPDGVSTKSYQLEEIDVP
jgi:hypothetical protein